MACTKFDKILNKLIFHGLWYIYCQATPLINKSLENCNNYLAFIYGVLIPSHLIIIRPSLYLCDNNQIGLFHFAACQTKIPHFGYSASQIIRIVSSLFPHCVCVCVCKTRSFSKIDVQQKFLQNYYHSKITHLQWNCVCSVFSIISSILLGLTSRKR